MHNFAVAPGAFDVVLVQGTDAARFLQGQLTCDVAALADNQLVQGACCTNKGRVVATFTLVRQQDRYYLCMAKDLARVLVDTLRKYVAFYKQCTLTIPADRVLTGHVGDHAGQLLQKHGISALPPATVAAITGGWVCRLPGATARVLCWDAQNEQQSATTAALEQWEALALLNGEFPLHAGDTGLFTPQELHLDRNGYISFDKGCYTGQEIVARMHYRGKLKKALFLVTLSSPLQVAGSDTSTPVATATGNGIGRCLMVRPLADSQLALLELPADYAGQLAGLTVGGIAIRKGCLFEPTVIQSANLQTA
jgi:folate-binding protein YgfZ